MAAGIMLLLVPIIIFPASILVDHKGTAYAVKLGCILTIIGSWIRTLANKDFFTYVMLGQFFNGLAAPFIYNSRCALGATWFSPETIPAVT